GTPGQTRPQKPWLLRESLHRVRKPRAFKRGLFSRVQQCKVVVCHFDGLPNCSSANKMTADDVVKEKIGFQE
ncbi:MAG: hypothetical protein KIC91_09615, partial [Sutterella sp.]|nr:hypothetical protein [Sutterella sp.]